MKVKILSVFTPHYIYHGCSAHKRFWEGQCTPVSMKSCGRRNVRKHREIKGGEKCIILYISLKFFSLDKMKITSSEPKDYLGISGKGLITYMGLKTIVRSNKNKTSSYAITNVSLKGISKIIKEFEKFPFGGYVRNKPKHELTDSYFYLARHIDKCMMRHNNFNLHVDTVRKEITRMQQIPVLQVYSTGNIE